MTDVLHIDVRWIVQLALCSALLACIALVSFRRNAVTRRAYALIAGLLLTALPFALAASSGWHWTLPFEAVALLSLAGSVPIPLWLVALWAGVGIGLNATALVHAAQARRRLRTLPAVDDADILAEAEAVAQRLAFARPFRLHFGPAPCSSSLAGDRIVLPADAKRWQRSTLRAVLAHEIVHLLRRDDVCLLALRLVLHWYWFAPWVALLRRQYASAMEQSCDDRAAECLPSCAEYLDGVLCAARTQRKAPSIAAALAGSEIVVRFQRFLGVRERQLDVSGVYWGLTAVLGAALLATSIEFASQRPLPTWTAAGVANSRPMAFEPPPSALPRIRERAVAGDERAIRRDSRPIYPGHALENGIEGHAVAAFRVSLDGRVVRPRIIASAPPDVFDNAVLRALGRREYVSGTDAAGVHLTVPVAPAHLVRRFEFRLPELPND